MSEARKIDPIASWESIKPGGLLLAPKQLDDLFPESLPPLPKKAAERLRRAITELNGDGRIPAALMDAVLEDVLGLGRALEPETGSWLKGNALSSEWSHRSITGTTIKPQRVWQGDNGAELPVFVDTERRIGIGRGRRMPAHVVEWLRATERPLAVLTNGRQWRLIHASLDADAFAEWDTGLWFEEGEPGPQVTALRALLDRARLTPKAADEPAPLLAAIADSRKGQGELSAALGERVRQAVELLIRRVFPEEQLPNELEETEATRKQIYRAATRAVMRMVVILFAEARDDLLPRSNPTYHLSYGLQGLREALQQAGAGTKEGLARLAHRRSAWPRVLSLFRLIYNGSPHKDLTLPRYGGGLFEPGKPASADALDRALAALEDPARGPHDADVYRMLDFLCVTETRVRQGTSYKRIPMPVNFADLSSEYIGILYEGLLDYELRRAAPDDPMVFLNLGDQPALPLSRLEAMSDKALSDLVDKLKVKASKGDEDDSDDEDAETSDDLDADDTDGEGEAAETGDDAAEVEESDDDTRRAAEDRALEWAREAVTAAGIVKKPKSKKKEALGKHEQEIEAAARSLIARTILPGEWFLVRWGGTRKGAGTFYTRPGLAVPTVHRTLRPLAYDPPKGKNGKPDEDAPPADWTPKKPEEILDLKVCDPAMGSASFLVASLRFLTDALYAALHHHGRIAQHGDKTLVTLAEGKASEGKLGEETLPCRPEDENFETRLRAILKRYVVERCIYGVDIDPLAVELGRLSLWVETLDYELPFEFLDHKLRPGNSLVGCWFDRFRDYPILAWERDGGDTSHSNGSHFDKANWANAIREARNGVVKRELIDFIDGQMTIDDKIENRSPEEIHDEAVRVLETMHGIALQRAEERAQIYREQFLDNPAIRRLRNAFNSWCAVWFWPADHLEVAPTPQTLGRTTSERDAIVEQLAREHRFFHWEIEFPDVFCPERTIEPEGGTESPAHAGFDAIVGNPPWEIQKPNSKEFFSNLDPLYRSYGKQDALRKQEGIFEDSKTDERAWLDYNARFKALSNWTKSAGSPFGDGADDGTSFSFGRGHQDLHPKWAALRGGHRGYADPRHPFRHQGSADINTYKMFLETAHALCRPSGEIGMIIPSGLYTDKGTTGLRELFLEHCDWQWLFGFENKLAIFDIHRSFKFCPLIARKGGTTKAIRTAFMRHDLSDWADAERHVIPYARKQVERFSPRTRAILEIREKRDLEILEKIYANSVLLGDDSEEGWGIKYANEFHMTNDSKLFPPRPRWEERGYVPDEYGRWIKFKGKPNAKKNDPEVGWIRLRDDGGAVAESDIKDVALPLYEGRMIGQFDFSQKGWVSGKGRSAVWRDIDWSQKSLEPQYLMADKTYADYSGDCAIRPPTKVVFMDITSATNARTMIATSTPDLPCGNSAPTLRGDFSTAALAAILCSLTYDYVARARCGGLHLNYFVIEETPLPLGAKVSTALVSIAASLMHGAVVFAPDWHRRSKESALTKPWRNLWAISPHERIRLRCMIDAVVAFTYGLMIDEFRWILRDCDHPADAIGGRSLDPKGFWRVAKQLEPELRPTVLSQVAFVDLEQIVKAKRGDPAKGIAAFLGYENGGGWQIPENLRLADYGLGHDARAKKQQPVRERLGERFLPWQTKQSARASWKECEIHARNILGEKAFANLGKNAEHGERVAPAKGSGPSARIAQGDLFAEQPKKHK